MPKNNKPEDNVDWSLATWEGSRREQLRRWAQLPLERIIAALEEMQELNETLTASAPETGDVDVIQEQQGKYDPKADGSNKPNNRDDNDG